MRNNIFVKIISLMYLFILMITGCTMTLGRNNATEKRLRERIELYNRCCHQKDFVAIWEMFSKATKGSAPKNGWLEYAKSGTFDWDYIMGPELPSIQAIKIEKNRARVILYDGYRDTAYAGYWIHESGDWYFVNAGKLSTDWEWALSEVSPKKRK